MYSIELACCYPNQTPLLCHMLEEHRESCAANRRRSSVVARKSKIPPEAFPSVLELCFHQGSAPVLLPPLGLSGMVCVSDPDWPAISAQSSSGTGSAQVTQWEQLMLHHLQSQFLSTSLRGMMLGTGVPAGSRNCQWTVLAGLLGVKDSVG